MKGRMFVGKGFPAKKPHQPNPFKPGRMAGWSPHGSSQQHRGIQPRKDKSVENK